MLRVKILIDLKFPHYILKKLKKHIRAQERKSENVCK